MTRADLDNLQKLRVEVVDLAREINKASKTHIIDVVLGSRHVIPYDLHPIVVEGIDSDKVIQLRTLLRATCDKVQAALYEMEQWIENIEDAEMRSIIRMYYCQGKTQREIGAELGYDRSLISKRLNEFMGRIE